MFELFRDSAALLVNAIAPIALRISLYLRLEIGSGLIDPSERILSILLAIKGSPNTAEDVVSLCDICHDVCYQFRVVHSPSLNVDAFVSWPASVLEANAVLDRLETSAIFDADVVGAL
ncbi:hypothetical protein E6O75_ATG02372 [Venturia nashicola]|uniref:Uncharacterized protein n=1 Tax=Venturia nashicola TaxID=86259 RepID=A0A4Z1P4X7_9PEZI|nr:hypothetical protein E6O75_ATG02372 [Venturia nashicola]